VTGSLPSAHDELPLGRLEAFSDGVFAIAVTLLVLELSVSADAGDHLLKSIVHEWPSYLAYVTSFLTIGVVWLQHSAITGALRAADAMLYRINLLVLLLASFLPFPTKLAAEYFGDTEPERVAAVFYGLTLLALSLSLTAFVRYAAEHPALVAHHVEAERIEEAVAYLPNLGGYAVGIGVSLLVPSVGVVIYLASAIVRGLPARTVHDLLRRRRAS
jgi:uncharacterized membrane protein